jgi:hypothetical protein
MGSVLKASRVFCELPVFQSAYLVISSINVVLTETAKFNEDNYNTKFRSDRTITDYSGRSATEADNSLQIPRKLARGE